MTPPDAATTPRPTVAAEIGFREFLVLIAAMMSCQALAIDAMLPALPTIAHALGVTNENHAQWIIMAYMMGLGFGQLVWGMLSDRFGRRTVLLVGLAMYAVASLAAGLSTSFESLLAMRFVHGAAAASVVVARSVIRDLYSGRAMARVMSLTFIVFLIVPILAPSIGQLALLLWPWRYLFVVFSGFAVVVWIWVVLRLPETLHPEYRLPLDMSHVTGAMLRVLRNRASLCYSLAGCLMFGSILAYVGMVQQIFDQVFHRSALMPAMFAVCASLMGVASYVNSRIVERVGMRRISQVGLLLFMAVTLTHSAVAWLGFDSLAVFVVLQAATLGCVGIVAGNFGAMAMEPMGEIAGIAASLQGFIGAAGAAAVGALIGRSFNGSTLPLSVGAVLCGFATLLLVLIAERGRLFQTHHVTRMPADAVL